jgi:hypothetical protein
MDGLSLIGIGLGVLIGLVWEVSNQISKVLETMKSMDNRRDEHLQEICSVLRDVYSKLPEPPDR